MQETPALINGSIEQESLKITHHIISKKKKKKKEQKQKQLEVSED